MVPLFSTHNAMQFRQYLDPRWRGGPERAVKVPQNMRNIVLSDSPFTCRHLDNNPKPPAASLGSRHQIIWTDFYKSDPNDDCFTILTLS